MVSVRVVRPVQGVVKAAAELIAPVQGNVAGVRVRTRGAVALRPPRAGVTVKVAIVLSPSYNCPNADEEPREAVADEAPEAVKEAEEDSEPDSEATEADEEAKETEGVAVAGTSTNNEA